MKNYFPWLVVGVAVFLNHYFRFFILQSNADTVFKAWPIIGDMRYGVFLTQKWLLVIIALLMFCFWLKKKKNIVLEVKKYRLPVMIILLVTLVSHIFSFNRWFEFDDYRVIGHHHAVSGTADQNQMGLSNSTSYAIGMVYLVVRWFDTNFTLYNSLGLFFYFLTGVAIFAFVVKLQKKKTVALLAALFFVTSPTYWRQILQMQEFIGDGFSALLFALTNLQLLFGFYPGAVLSAAASLEFGLSRTHFISLPLFLITLLLAPRYGVNRRHWIIALAAFPMIMIFYLPIFIEAFPESIDRVNIGSNLANVLRVFDSVFAVSIPHAVAFQLIWFFRWLFNHNVDISVICGIILIGGLLATAFWLYHKKKILAAKLVFVGTVSVVAAITLPTLSGIRIIQNLKDLTIQYDDFFPTAPTSYGVFSTFGMVFVIVGFSQILRRRLFRNVMIALISINAVTIMKSDLEWAKIYSAPPRALNPQLETLIPADGKIKVIYNPPPTEVLSRYIDLFYQLYRIKEPIYIQNDAQAFIDLLDKYKPETDHIYAFVMDTKTYKITDLSEKLRNYPTGKLTLSLVKETLK